MIRSAPQSRRSAALRAALRGYLVAGPPALLFLAFLALYVRTAAPSVLSGDSAEFQLAAPLLGVPHPTTYPMYMLLGKLATLALPFGDLAWRVTMVSALSGALAVALFFLLARRVTQSAPAAAIGALALGLAPGLWNAATMAEVYALLAALLVALAYVLVAAELSGQGSSNRPPTPNAQHPTATLRLAAFLGGLGFAHHGLFVIAGLPLLAGYVLWRLVWRSDGWRGDASGGRGWQALREIAQQLAILALCFAAGLLPWLYPLAQYWRYGPFADIDYGLPRHYFWGAPESWGQALDLLTGGPMRRGVFRLPTLESSSAVVRMVGQRLLFEFGPVGVLLGLLGSMAMLRRARASWVGAAWMFFATLAYLLLLGPAVQDAPVFTLPMLLPWALWIAAAAELLHALWLRRAAGWRAPWTMAALALLLVATLAWGYTRLHVSSKRQLWLFRRFGEATLEQLPPNAAVIAHWEQGMTLQYLILAEHRRPDIWVDIVEPGDESWSQRAQRYQDRPVFFVGSPADVRDLPVALLREDTYADLFALHR